MGTLDFNKKVAPNVGMPLFAHPPPTDCIVNSALQFSVSNIIIPKNQI